MRKKILSIYLAAAIGFLSVIANVVPVYAANSTNWEDYFKITYSATDETSPYSLDFKNATAQTAYEQLSKDERKKVDYGAFTAISEKDQQHKYSGTVLNKTTLPDFIMSIAKAAGIAIPGGISGGGGISADLQNKLTSISNSISASNRKFGGGGMSFTASSTNPANFGLGKLTLTKDFINDLRSNIAEFDNYTIYPALSENAAYYPSLIGAVNFTSYNKEFTNSFHKKHYNVFYENDTKYPSYMAVYFCGNSDDLIYYFKQSGLLSYGYRKSDGTYTFAEVKGGYKLSAYDDDSLQYVSTDTSSTAFEDRIKYNNKAYYLGRIGRYTKVFNSYTDVKNYINTLQGFNTSNYYISNTVVNNDYSTTINKIYDYSSNDTYTTINNNITQAISDAGTSGLTDEEYQKIVDDVLKQVQEEIDAKEDTDDSGTSGGGTSGDSGNTGGSGTDDGSGGSSGTESDSGSGNSDTWLEKIFDRLGDILEKIGTITGIETIIEYLKQISDDVATLKEGGSLSADMSDTNGLLKDIKGLLGTLIAVQAVGDVADLLADTVGDKINDYADNLKSAVTEVADALQDVFPFSIPWDLMAILALFSAEAQAPVFDIPVNIPQLGVEHTIHVDLSDFESVSVICRAFLSVSFAVGLMYLTIRITGGKDDD